MSSNYAKRMSSLKASEVREMLKIAQNPNIISFAGGMPSPELFPLEEIKKANQAVLEEFGTNALQYSPAEGYEPLREWIASRMNQELGTRLDKDGIMITHGSQQAIDFMGRVFIDEGDIVLCESPTYLAAITAFAAYGCKFIEIETDDDGMVMEDLESILKSGEKVKVIYIVPTFQNPTGRTWSLERRRRLAELAVQYNVMVLEDNPYSELRFEGQSLPSVKAFDTSDNIMCTGTFSKTYCPGYRIGWIAGGEDIIRKFVLAKQAADLQCNTLAQIEISKYLEMYDFDAHINEIREVYHRRRDLALEVMDKDFPAGIKYTRPGGGLFAWVELPENINAREVLKRALEKNVAFVPGDSFYPSEGHQNTFRITFSCMTDDRIREGLKILSSVLKEFI